MKKCARILSLLMSAVMLVSSAVPAYAFEDALTGFEESGLFDSEEAPPLWDSEEDSLTWEDAYNEENSDQTQESPSESDVQQPEDMPENPPMETEGEIITDKTETPLPTELVTGTSGLDLPDGWSFEMSKAGGSSRPGMFRSSPGTITVYIQKISG